MSEQRTRGPFDVADRGDYSDFDGQSSILMGDGGEVRIAAFHSEADAKFFALVANSHQALVDALEAAKEGVKLLNDLTSCRGDDDYVWGLQAKIDAALLLASGEIQ